MFTNLIKRGGPDKLMVDTMVLMVLIFTSISMTFYIVAFCWIGCSTSSSLNTGYLAPLFIFVVCVLPLLVCGSLGITMDLDYNDFVESNLNGTIDIYGHSRTDGIELDYYKCLKTNDDHEYD